MNIIKFQLKYIIFTIVNVSEKNFLKNFFIDSEQKLYWLYILLSYLFKFFFFFLKKKKKKKKKKKIWNLN